MNGTHDIPREVAGEWDDSAPRYAFTARQLIAAAAAFLAMFVLVVLCAYDSSVNWTRGDTYRRQRDVATWRLDRVEAGCRVSTVDQHAECAPGVIVLRATTTTTVGAR